MKKSLLVSAAIYLSAATPVYASYDLDLGEGHKITFGGYLKADARYVDGDVAYQDYWLGNVPSGTPTNTEKLSFNIRESRINTKYSYGDISAFIEMDFYGGGGNQAVSNSSSPRIRRAFIKYRNFLVGQAWTTFMNTATLPETLDFAGPTVGEVFVRQAQLRYTLGGLQLAIETPETVGDGNADADSSGIGLSGNNADAEESVADLIAKYTFSGDWGQISAAAMLRRLDQGELGIEKTATAFSLAGKIILGQDDIRFQMNQGETGRYVGPGLTSDIVTNPETGKVEVEKTTAFTVAYRHVWSSKFRSTAFYGTAETDILEHDRSHWGLNLIKQMDEKINIGIEYGNYEIADSGAEKSDSDYLQASLKFVF